MRASTVSALAAYLTARQCSARTRACRVETHLDTQRWYIPSNKQAKVCATFPHQSASDGTLAGGRRHEWRRGSENLNHHITQPNSGTPSHAACAPTPTPPRTSLAAQTPSPEQRLIVSHQY